MIEFVVGEIYFFSGEIFFPVCDKMMERKKKGSKGEEAKGRDGVR
jgi:hypothetical protein